MKKSIIRLFLLMSFFVTMGSTNIKASMIDADVTGDFQNPYSASAMNSFTDNTTMDAATAPFGDVKPYNNGDNPPMYLPPDPNEPFPTPLGAAIHERAIIDACPKHQLFIPSISERLVLSQIK